MKKYAPFHKHYPLELQNFVNSLVCNEFTAIQKEALKEIPIDPNIQLCDYIIASETASGKTEAVYLPLIARMIKQEQINHGQRKDGVIYLYISPLIALINDQYERISQFCAKFGFTPVKWHSGSNTNKSDIKNVINGILLTTPESLEGFLSRSSQENADINKIIGTEAIIIDEVHSYFSNARGRHLQSVLHRLDEKAQKKIPRLALSATLGTALDASCDFLRPKYEIDKKPKIIRPITFVDNCKNQSVYEIIVYFDSHKEDMENKEDHAKEQPLDQIAKCLWKDFSDLERGLVFTNSRAFAELIHEKIVTIFEVKSCRIGDSFEITRFPVHHSSIKKQERYYIEKIMRGESLMCGGKKHKFNQMTPICTSTLELGIDIGKVEKVGQIEPPYTVASLRQRVGRSGRRDKPPYGITYVIEKEVTDNDHPLDRLHVGTYQATAAVNLALQDRFEEPNDNDIHLSTLVHQILMLIYEKGIINTKDTYELLVKSGPWDNRIISYDFFSRFIESLSEGAMSLIQKVVKDKTVEEENDEWIIKENLHKKRRPSFAVFSTPPEYSVICGNNIVGKLPMIVQYNVGETFVLRGGRWKVQTISEERRVIQVVRTPFAGAPRYGGSAQVPSRMIVEEMYRLYTEEDEFQGVNSDTLVNVIEDGRRVFLELKLNENKYLQHGSNVLIFPWCGSRLSQTLLLLFRKDGLRASTQSFAIIIENCKIQDVKECVNRILENSRNAQRRLELDELAREASQLCSDRYDRYLIPYHQRLAFSRRFLDDDGIIDLLKSLQ